MLKYKKRIASVTVCFIFLSLFNFGFVLAENGQEPELAAYIENDFRSGSELSDFIPDSASDWSIADGKLICAVTDTSVRYIEKEVHIPEGQSFALEISAENLSGYSNLVVSLNDTESLRLAASGTDSALDGEWALYFDRIDGIKAFRDGEEVFTSGNPRISGSSIPQDAISRITVSFQGEGNGNDPAFDYIYAYGYGNTGTWTNDYSSDANGDYIYELRYGGSIHELTVADGKAFYNREQSILSREIEIDSNDDVILKCHIENSLTYKRFHITANRTAKMSGYTPGNSFLNGDYTVILSRSGAAKIYKNGVQVSSNASDAMPETITEIGVETWSNDTYFDDFNIYTQGLRAEIADATTTELKLSANMPIVAAEAGGVSASVVKRGEGHLVYDIVFDAELEGDSNYTLKATTPFGKTAEIAFSTPISQTVANALERLNTSEWEPTGEEESFREVVQEVADLFDIASYRNDDKIIEIAANLRDENGGFKDKANVKTVFDQANLLLTKKDGDISGFLNEVNGITPFEGEILNAYKERIGAFAQAMVDEAMLVSEFKTFRDVGIELEEYVILYGITFADNSEEIGYIITEFGQNILGLTEEEVAADSEKVNETLKGLSFATFADVAAKYRDIINDVQDEASSEFYYIHNEFNKASEKNGFQLSTTADWSVEGGKLLCDTHKDNVTVHTVGKNVSIAAEDSFVLEFSCEHLYRWSDMSIYLGDVEVVKVNAQNASFDGEWKLVFDRDNGVTVYKNDAEISAETAPRIVKNSIENIKEVSKIEIKFRGSHDRGDGICTFDYIKAYKITSDIEILDRDHTEWDSVEVGFSPIVTEGTDLKDYILADGNPVAGVDKVGENRYLVRFASGLTPNETHTLSIQDLHCAYGIVIDGDFEFKTRDRQKDISMHLLNPTFTSKPLGFRSKVVVETQNEFDDSEAIVLIAAIYTADGMMADIVTQNAVFSDGIGFFDIDTALSEKNITVELYAVDSLSTWNRVSKKLVYRATADAASAQTAALADIDNEGLTFACQKDLVESKIIVHIAKEVDKNSEVTVAVSEGYDVTAPSFELSDMRYIKHEVLSDTDTETVISVPDENKNYDVYAVTKDAGVRKIASVSMHKVEDVKNAFQRLNTAKLHPASGQESFGAVVDEVADIFDISEWKDNDSVIELACNLRDEKGGFQDENDVKAMFELAEFIAKKDNGNIDGFIDTMNEVVSFNAEVLSIYKDGKISEKAISDVKNTIRSAKFKNLADIQKSFGEYVVLSGIQYASHYSQITNLIKELGTSVIGLTANEVSKLRDDVSIGLLGKSFRSMDAVKSEYRKLIAKSADNGGGSSGSSGGSSSGGGASFPQISYPAGEKPVDPANQNPQDENIFTDLGAAEWAKSSVLRLANLGIVSGRGNGIFAPDDTCTRAEMAKMICLAFRLSSESDISFTDVRTTDWSYPYIKAVYGNSVMLGVSDAEFAPGTGTTREMLAVIICRAAVHAGKKIPDASSDFEDIMSASEYARDAIGALQKAGIVSGVDGKNYQPKRLCTRAEIAKVIDGFLQYLDE